MKLGLGTAQFGLDYGVSNQGGRTPEEEVARILNVAARRGIRVLDTAALYGMSETVLGNVLPEHHQFDVVTKTGKRQSAQSIVPADVQELEGTFYRSLKKLKQAAVYGLLIHDADDLLAENGHLLFEKMLELKRSGRVKKIGVSVYTGQQIDGILDRFQIDIIQLPLNVLDQRLIKGGYLTRLKALGVEIHARSVFLQGLLLMDPADLPLFFDPVREALRSYHEAVRSGGFTPVQAALGFLLGLPEIDVVLCGVNNQQQLEELSTGTSIFGLMDFNRYAIRDENFLNPANWKL